jgi:hypothetical protein
LTDPNSIIYGRIAPSSEKRLQNDRFSLADRFPWLAMKVGSESSEIELPLPPGLVNHYDQGNIGACTGYSASWMSSINNFADTGKVIAYDAYWLYKRGQEIDGDPNTSGDNDGGYVWAVHKILQDEGHKIKGGALSKEEGIDSYYWCRSVDEVRLAFELRRCPVFGMNWYQKFNTPQTYNSEFWIGRQANWGSFLGGHAIAARKKSDNRDGFFLRNSWGSAYPEVWISYSAIAKLFARSGECSVSVDHDQSDSDIASIEITGVTVNGRVYKGTLLGAR